MFLSINCQSLFKLELPRISNITWWQRKSVLNRHLKFGGYAENAEDLSAEKVFFANLTNWETIEKFENNNRELKNRCS